MKTLMLVSLAAVAVSLSHGFAYSADGTRLMVPSDRELAVHEGGKSSKAPGQQQDYVGLAATAMHRYNSGRLGRGAGLADPFFPHLVRLAWAK